MSDITRTSKRRYPKEKILFGNQYWEITNKHFQQANYENGDYFFSLDELGRVCNYRPIKHIPEWVICAGGKTWTDVDAFAEAFKVAQQIIGIPYFTEQEIKQAVAYIKQAKQALMNYGEV